MGDLYNCRVCGWRSPTPPWGESGKEPSFDICPCCECEWGYEDSGVESTKKYRAAWIASGANWVHDDTPHDGLTTEERLCNVPPGFE